ncbi:MAG: TlpA disulfide reductase family protein [Bryobacteraceae bacterium]|jgi:cytochrome c biogenesis protein CcmG/thiol:disulfide interchange protein DsbE
MKAALLFFALVSLVAAADQTTLRSVLLSPAERKPAPGFALKDASGRIVKLANYRGKVVLLDFWATWCGGCKQELPLFSEFQRTYGAKGLAVVGVSLDDDGWKVVKPFLDSNQVPYRMVLGNSSTAKRYGIGNMPDTFIIDQQGRLAAAYRGGLVDRDDVDANLRALLSTH